jgi:hypothetical protein
MEPVNISSAEPLYERKRSNDFSAYAARPSAESFAASAALAV